MDKDEIKRRYHLTDEQYSYLQEHIEYLLDINMLGPVIYFGKSKVTDDPYYKFVDVLKQVEAKDYVNMRDLRTLDKRYGMRTVDYLIGSHGEYYTDWWSRDSQELAKHIGRKNKTFNFDMFCEMLRNMVP